MSSSTTTESRGGGHVIFFNFDGVGHVNPSLPLVVELIKRRVTVSYFLMTTDFRVEQTFEVIKKVGGKVIDINALYPEAPPFPFGKSPFFSSIPFAQHYVPLLLPLVREMQPSVIVYDPFTVFGYVIAKLLKVPCVYSLTAPPLGPDSSNHGLFKHPFVLSSNKHIKNEYSIDLLDMLHPCLTYTYKDVDLNLIFSIPSRVKFNFPDINQFDVMFSGPIIAPELRLARHGSCLEKVKEWKQKGGTVIFVSLGTVVPKKHSKWLPGFFQDLIEISEKLSNTMILFATCVEVKLQQVPDNVLVELEVPQLEVLQLVDGFITHGGAGSINESLYYGVPMLVIPFFGDQPENAKWITHIGAGMDFELDEQQDKQSPERKSLTQATLEQGIHFLLKKETKENVKTLSKELQSGSENGCMQIVDAIEKMIRKPLVVKH